MAAPCPLLSDGITDDTLLHIAHFLSSATDLLCLMLTNSKFAAKVIIALRPASSEGWQRQRPAGDVVHRGRGGAGVGGGLQRAGAWLGAAS